MVHELVFKFLQLLSVLEMITISFRHSGVGTVLVSSKIPTASYIRRLDRALHVQC